MKYNYLISKSSLHFTLIIGLVFIVGSCKTQKTTVSTPEPTSENKISYEKEILPIMKRSCTPCHFPEEGRKKMLDTYDATSKNIHEIIERIALPATDPDYMPFKSKKPALSAEEVKLFKDWLAQGMSK